ncbi:MAG: ROK family protein [Trueperaceae bacterium]|nr:ROK family protein [Trueperaceae bacterium]
MPKDYVVGIDLGGTKSALALLDENNQIVARARIATEADEGPDNIIGRLLEEIETFKAGLAADVRLAAVGVCAPGPLDHEQGIMLSPTNMPRFHNTPLKTILEERLGVPARLEHDAKAAALGELYAGEGQGFNSLVYIVIGTGVGAAIILNGDLYRGEKNFAGEIGHATLDRYGEPCHCGSRGCFETFMSGPSLTKRYARLCPDVGQISGAAITERAKHGDEAALQIIHEAGEALGVMVATTAMMLDIERFIVGGSVAKAGDLLINSARTTIPKYSFKSFSSRISLVSTKLGEDAAILGAAHLARQALS